MAERSSHEGHAGPNEEGTSPLGSRPPVNSEAIWAACAALIAGFLLVDFLTPQVSPNPDSHVSEAIFCLLMGLCIAQVNLLATWAVLAPGNIVVRLPWALLLSMLMWFALVLGRRIAVGMRSSDSVVLGVVLLTGSVLLQVPLWIAKKLFAWRMLRPGELLGAETREDRQFDLRQMLLGMLLFALALAPLRFLVPHEALDISPMDLYEIPVMLVAALLCNLLVTIPCIWGGLLLLTRLVPAALGWLGYCLLLTLAEIALISAFLRPPPRLFVVCCDFYLLNVTQCVAVFGTLRLFRHLGFRLLRLPRKGRASSGP